MSLSVRGPELMLREDQGGRPKERDDDRRNQPRIRPNPQEQEEPAPHEAADHTEGDVADRPVAALFHDMPGQITNDQPYDNPHREHSQCHGPSPFA